jgi:hypothetical protein
VSIGADTMIEEVELKELEKRAAAWDSSIALEILRLVNEIRDLKVENEFLKAFMLKVKEAEKERDESINDLNKSEEKLREIARIVSEYSEENEITSLDAHKKINETIKKFLEGQ